MKQTPFTKQEIAALNEYAANNGRNWKAILFADRMSSRPLVEGPLRALVNRDMNAIRKFKPHEA